MADASVARSRGGNSEDDVAKLEKLRVDLKKLAVCYKQILEKLKAKLESGITVQDVARSLRRNVSGVKQFLDRERIIFKGEIYTRLIEYLEAAEIGQEITELCKTVSGRYVILALYPDQTIDVCIDLSQRLAKHGKVLNFETLSQCFGEQRDLVLQLLKSVRVAFKQLDDQDTITALSARLADPDLEKDILAELVRQKERRAELGKEVSRLMEELKPRHDGMTMRVCEVLEVSRSSMAYAISGGDSTVASRQEELIAMMTELLETGKVTKTKPQTDDESSDSADAESSPVDQSPGDVGKVPQKPRAPVATEIALGDFKSPEALLETVAGVETEAGVKYVLGPGVLKDLKIQMAGELIEPTRWYLTIARAHLNIFTQSDNPELRDKVAKALSEEVEEMQRAIELFSAKYPNNLTELHEEQRQVAGGMAIRSKKQHHKKVRKR